MEKLTVQQALDRLKELHLKYAGKERLTPNDSYTFEPTFTMQNGEIERKYFFAIFSSYEKKPFNGFTFQEVESELADAYPEAIENEQIEIIL